MAPESAVLTDQAEEESSSLFKALLENLPPSLREGFSSEQRAALREAADRCNWGGHATDIRLSIPLISKRYYLVLLAGEERRNRDRLRREREERPVATLGNVAFLVGLVSLGTIIGSFAWTLLFVWYMSL